MTTNDKPMSLVEAHKRVKEHKLTARIEGKKQGQAVASRDKNKSGDRKGKH
jgi:hypothetical protein